MTLLPTLLLGAALCAAVWIARQRRQAAREGFIQRYGFPQRLRLKLLERYPQLSPEQTARVLLGLREYFQLCRIGGRPMVAMPSQAVDLAWHEFILHTRQYQRFCRQGLGRFLHHTPSEAMRGPTQAQASIRRAWRLACAREGIAAKAPSRLPLLFALDAELGIADGLRYQLNCREGPRGAADGYCASHIGCAGDSASDSSSSSADGGGDGAGCGGGCGGGGD
ncbi:MAG: glycine-rich domain-containing protein [Pseudomonas sp.]